MHSQGQTDALSQEASLRSFCRTTFSQDEVRRIDAAIDLARAAHVGQLRRHGAPYITHPLRVSPSLIEEFGITDSVSITTAILHDVLKDAPDRVSAADIEAVCGADVARAVEHLTSPTAEQFPDKTQRNRAKAEKVARAPRLVWRIKLADRIDNLRDSLSLSEESGQAFRRRYLRESQQYYVPLAAQLGEEHVQNLLHEALRQLTAKVMEEDRQESRHGEN